MIVQLRVPEGARWERVRGVSDAEPHVDVVRMAPDSTQLVYAGAVVLVWQGRLFTVHTVGDDGELSEPDGEPMPQGPAGLSHLRWVFEGAGDRARADADASISTLRRIVGAAIERDGDLRGWASALRSALGSLAAGRYPTFEGLEHDDFAAIREWSEVEADAALTILDGLDDEIGAALDARVDALAFDQRRQGLLLDKYRVQRTDGRDRRGGDRCGAEYLVLDLTYDPHAAAAVAAYAVSVAADYPQLAEALMARPEVARLIEGRT